MPLVVRVIVLALFASLVSGVPGSAAAADPVRPVPSVSETTPVASAGDAIDDPAVWVHPTDPASSLVIGNDKLGALETYDLQGDRVQRLTDPVTAFWGNVDVRQSVTVAGTRDDVVAVYHRGLQLYRVDPTTRLLRLATEGTAIPTDGEGLCLYSSASSGRLYAFVIARSGAVRQLEIRDADADGLLEGVTVRQFAVGSEAEGCVADDDTGALYIGEEDRGLWRYAAEPTGGSTRALVDSVTTADGGHLTADVEGVTLVDLPDGRGYVIASAQNGADLGHSYFVVYDRRTNAYVDTFRVTDGASSDDCDGTDGLTAVAADLGSGFPQGVFVCQDNNNDVPGTVGNQNLKLVPVQTVVDLSPLPPPPTSVITALGASTTNANALSWSRQVPTTVRAGDGMLLAFSTSTDPGAFAGPGAGWTLLDQVVDGTLVSTVWQRVASEATAGSTVRVSYAAGIRRGALTLSTYRGTRTTAPFATGAGRPEPGTTATHTTPVVPVAVDGSWRVCYWADRASTAAGWTQPPGESVRSVSAGSGGGRIGVLLTDPGVAVGPGPTGGLSATSASTSAKATSWTVVLAPAVSASAGD